MSIQNVAVQVPPLSRELIDALEKDVPLEVLLVMAGSVVTASNNGLLDLAQAIADGLTPHFSKHVFVAVLDSSLACATGRHAEALQILERVMKANPGVDTLVCMCASLRKSLGAPGWRGLAQCVIDRGEDADLVRIAEALLAGPMANLDKVAAPSAKAALANLRFA